VGWGHRASEWIANQLTEACGWEQIPRYLIRDRDGAYGEIFIRRIRSFGIRDRPTSPRSPWQNAYAERLIGSIRRECLDHIVVFGERHLRHVLLSYMDYYNRASEHPSVYVVEEPRILASKSAALFVGALHHNAISERRSSGELLHQMRLVVSCHERTAWGEAGAQRQLCEET
jgi:transposase InsO family protein